MARAAASDPLHNFRFHVRAIAADSQTVNGSNDILQPAGVGPGFTIGDGAEAGFQAVTTPEFTLEHVEYREGTKIYTEKYPGIPTVGDMTMSRGVARKDTSFFDWIVRAIEGAEYRCDLVVYHFLRGSRSVSFQTTDVKDTNTKRYIIRNGSPGRVKVAADLDASTGDVSLAEVDVIYERFEIQKDTAAAGVVPNPAPPSLAT
jgi:phage tail-like protein